MGLLLGDLDAREEHLYGLLKRAGVEDPLAVAALPPRVDPIAIVAKLAR